MCAVPTVTELVKDTMTQYKAKTAQTPNGGSYGYSEDPTYVSIEYFLRYLLACPLPFSILRVVIS